MRVRRSEGGAAEAAGTQKARREPAYLRISEDLRRKVETGAWPAGALIPSRQAISREYGVDVSTVQRAIADLIADGTLRADRGRGTFVARDVPEQNTGGDEGAIPAVPVRVPVLPPASSTGAPGGAYASGPSAVVAAEHPVSARLTLGKFGMLCKLYGPNDFWPRTVIHGMERVVSEGGGTTRFLNLAANPGGGSQNVAPREGARRLADEGARVLAIVDLRDDWTEEEIAAAVAGFGGDASRVAVVSAVELSLPVPHLLIDQQHAGYVAMRHLIDRGAYRDVVFFAPYTRPWVLGRWEGVRQALRFAGLPEQVATFFPPRGEAPSAPQPHPDEGESLARAAARRMLAERVPFSAVVAANDQAANAFAAVARAEAGLEAGRDYALVGFDDDPEARDVGLTSLRPPLEELGREAGALLLRMAAGENACLQMRLGSFLVPRATTYGVPLPAPVG